MSMVLYSSRKGCRVIAAVDALRLEKARITPEDRVAVERFLDDLDIAVRENFDGGPLAVMVKSLDVPPRILSAVARRCRRSGWIVGLNPIVEKSTISGQPRIVAFQVILEPKPEVPDSAMCGVGVES